MKIIAGFERRRRVIDGGIRGASEENEGNGQPSVSTQTGRREQDWSGKAR